MAWIVMGVVGLLAVAWWLGRPPAGPTPRARAATGMSPLAAEVVRRVTDPNDPDGAFMDGYVSGRYTERYIEKSDCADHASSRDADVRARPGDDDPDDFVWADPHDSFDDDSSDDW